MGEPLSRRDFLKLSGVLTGSAVMLPLKLDQRLVAPGDKPPLHESTWQNPRFFENIKEFDVEVDLPWIEKGLLDFSSEYGPLMKSIKFDQSQWESHVKKTMELLKRTKLAYDGLKDSPRAQALLEGEFYQAGSMPWAVLQIKERFHRFHNSFTRALEHPDLGSVENPKDPFLGEDIFSLRVSWANTWSSLDHRDSSSFLTLFATSGDYMSFCAGSAFLSNDRAELFNFEMDPKIPSRPKLMDIIIESKDEQMKQDLSDLLARHRLDRIADLLDIPSYDSDFTNGAFEDRNIVLTMDNNPSHENFIKYRGLWEWVLLHESGHGVMHLLPYLKGDQVVARVRSDVDQIMDYFRPYRSIEALFNPKGKFHSLLGKPVDVEKLKQTYNNLNEATMTHYPASEYLPVNYAISPMLRRLSYVMENKQVFDEDTILYRWLEMGNLDESKASYINRLAQTVKDNSSKMTAFEREVFDEFFKHVDLYDAPEQFFVPSDGVVWHTYFKEDVFGAIIADLMRRDPVKMEALILKMFSNPRDIRRAKSIFAHAQNDIKVWEQISDEELFPEIFQGSLRHRDKGVTDEISANIWKEVDPKIQKIIDTLIADGLAQEMKGRTA